jgi:hypothetical protein
MLEFDSEGSVGSWSNDVLGLLDIRQRMRIRGRGSETGGARGSGSSRMANLARSRMCLHREGAKTSDSHSTSGELPNTVDRHAGAVI